MKKELHAAVLALLLLQPICSSVDFFRQILEPDIFSAHGFQIDEAELLAFNTAASKPLTARDDPAYFCGPLTDMRRKMTKLAQISPAIAEHSHIVYVKKSEGRGCFMTRMTDEIVVAEKKIPVVANSTWTTEYLPAALKIHTSLLQYLSFGSRKASPRPDVEVVSNYKRRRTKLDQVQNKPELTTEEEIQQAGTKKATINCTIWLFCGRM